jgi:hypothetical protein
MFCSHFCVPASGLPTKSRLAEAQLKGGLPLPTDHNGVSERASCAQGCMVDAREPALSAR